MGSLRIAESPSELQLFLKETIENSKFEISKIRLSEQREWHLHNGALSHISNGFFHVTGLINCNTKEEKLVLYQPQSAYNGLALCKIGKIVYLLLQARVEPGNSGIGQFGPTIQSTPANYMRFHGGKNTPYLDLFFNYNPAISKPIGNSTQLDLGKRYFQKSKTLSYIEVNRLIETEENMVWVPLQVIAEVLSYDNYLNTDLRSMIGVFDWDLFLYQDDVLGFFSKGKNIDYTFLSESFFARNIWKLIPLSELNNWKFQDEGIIDLSNFGVFVNMYKVACTNREVKEWSQPLLCSSNRGLVVLFVRYITNNFEFLISVQSEFGISGEKVVLPSYVIYPGENHKNKSQLHGDGELISEMILSEEGGRFYQNENIYQVILVKEQFTIENDQHWVSAYILKNLLKSSNKVSIQLRCIASLVLHMINPYTFDRMNPSKESYNNAESDRSL